MRDAETAITPPAKLMPESILGLLRPGLNRKSGIFNPQKADFSAVKTHQGAGFSRQ